MTENTENTGEVEEKTLDKKDNTYDCKDTFYVFHYKILSYYKNIFELTINMKK